MKDYRFDNKLFRHEFTLGVIITFVIILALTCFFTYLYVIINDFPLSIVIFMCICTAAMVYAVYAWFFSMTMPRRLAAFKDYIHPFNAL